jgi:hypothetical protein
MQPKRGYARLGEDRIAHHAMGDGPVNVVDPAALITLLGDR